jgi:hypothetical protein
MQDMIYSTYEPLPENPGSHQKQIELAFVFLGEL